MQIHLDLFNVQNALNTYNPNQFRLWFLCQYLGIVTVQDLRKQWEAFAPFGYGRTTIYKYSTQIGLANCEQKSQKRIVQQPKE